MKKLIVSTLIIAVAFSAFSQNWSDDNDYKRLSLNLLGGPNLFHGDVDGIMGLSGTAGLELAISSSINLEGVFTYGTLQGDEPSSGNYFTNQFYQYGGRVNVLPLNILRLESMTQHVNPFLFVGGGRIVSDVIDVDMDLDRSFPGEAYKGTDLFLQTGAGAKIYITEHFDLNLRWDYNIPMTDKLDGHDHDVQNNLHDDRFNSFNIGVSYKFGKPKAQHLHWKSKGKKAKQDIWPRVNQTPEQEEVEVAPEPEPEPEPEPVKEPEPVPEEVYEEKIIFDPDTRIEPVLEAEGEDGEKLYYIIGGSFSQKTNATEFSNNLNKNGFQSYIVTNPEGTLFRVALGSFNDAAATVEALEKYRESHDPATWMIINETRYKE